MAANRALMVIGGVSVIRDGKNVYPKIGQPFEFTAEEAGRLLVQRRPPVRRLTVESVVELAAPSGPKADGETHKTGDADAAAGL